MQRRIAALLLGAGLALSLVAAPVEAAVIPDTTEEINSLIKWLIEGGAKLVSPKPVWAALCPGLPPGFAQRSRAHDRRAKPQSAPRWHSAAAPACRRHHPVAAAQQEQAPCPTVRPCVASAYPTITHRVQDGFTVGRACADCPRGVHASRELAVDDTIMAVPFSHAYILTK